ncbi:hypothetical protein JMJ77_0009712, partial [Colletotrichum scovillei]
MWASSSGISARVRVWETGTRWKVRAWLGSRRKGVQMRLTALRRYGRCSRVEARWEGPQLLNCRGDPDTEACQGARRPSSMRWWGYGCVD